MKIRYFLAAAIMLLLSSSSIKADSWTDKVKVKGDLRLRYENIDQELKHYRERFRFRARLNITGEVNDDIDIIVQLASGSDDPVSTNQTMTAPSLQKP